jgi:hypothetical protein
VISPTGDFEEAIDYVEAAGIAGAVEQRPVGAIPRIHVCSSHERERERERERGIDTGRRRQYCSQSQ